MNSKIQYSIVALLLFIPFVLLASTEHTIAKATKEKTINKSFTVSSDATLKIKNSYGNLDIVTWNENRIDFNIVIKVTGGNPDKVQDRLDDITVDFSDNGNIISAITKFEKKEKSWWNWGNSNKLKIEIHYRVKLPISNNVDLSNDYGSINLGKLEGRAKISCDYGKITTQELMADNNELSFDYSNNCYFEYIKSGKINADYSGFTLAKTKNLELNADYSKSIIEASENVTYNCDYGSLKVDNTNTLDGNGDYLTLRIQNVYKSVIIKADYGSIKIDRMASNARNLDINSEFTGISIGLDPSFNFDFDIDLQYASLSHTDKFSFTNKQINHSDKKYAGYHGSQNSGNLVKIKAEYGSLTFK
jgi:hypothetical protein